MQCNDECCESRDGKRKWKTNALISKAKEKSGKLNGDLAGEERKRPKPKPDVLDDKVIASEDSNTHNAEKAADELIDEERTPPKPEPDGLDDKVITSHDNTDSITQARYVENAENGSSEDIINEDKKRPTHKPNALDEKAITSQDNTTQENNDEDAENDIAYNSTDGERKWPKHKANVLDDKVTTSRQNTDNITQTNHVENEGNDRADNPYDEERKRPKDKTNVLDDKVIPSQDTTQAHNIEDAKNIIAALKKKIESLQIRLKKKNRPKEHNQLDTLLNDSIESNEDYNSTTSNETELSSYDEKDYDRYDQGKNESTTATQDLINDDDQEPTNSRDEEELHHALENDTRISLNESSYNEENNVSITNSAKEPGVEIDGLINGVNKINPTQSPTFRISNEIIDDKEKLNEISVVDMDDLDEKTAQEPNEDESRSGSIVNEPPSELGLSSLKDSAIDPTEELLNEEGIDDAGKFGGKRNFIRKRKKPH